jgi:hypothetical protein
MKIHSQICEYIGLKNTSIAKGTHQRVFFYCCYACRILKQNMLKRRVHCVPIRGKMCIRF